MDAIYCGGDLVGYGPHPNEVCALIEERGIPTIYGNYDYAIARDLDDCGCAYMTPHDRELGQRSVDWTLAHTDAALEGLHARPAVRSALLDRRRTACGWCTARRARSTSTCSRTSRPRSTSASPAQAEATCSSSATPTSRGCASTAGSSSSTAARSASPRTATRARRSRCSRTADGGVAVTIERVPYDAEAVAREVEAVGPSGGVRREAGDRGVSARPDLAAAPGRRGARHLLPGLRRHRRRRRERGRRQPARPRRGGGGLRPRRGDHDLRPRPPLGRPPESRRHRWPSRRRATSPLAEVGPYVVAQVAGAILASLALRGLFGAAGGLGATHPAHVGDARRARPGGGPDRGPDDRDPGRGHRHPRGRIHGGDRDRRRRSPSRRS